MKYSLIQHERCYGNPNTETLMYYVVLSFLPVGLFAVAYAVGGGDVVYCFLMSNKATSSFA